MPLPPRPQPQVQEDYEERLKKLEAREAYVKECEEALKQVELDIKIADETLASKQKQLDTLKADISKSSLVLRTLEGKIASQKKGLSAEIEDIKYLLGQRREELNSVEAKIKAANKEHTAVLADVGSLKKYLDSQEKLVSNSLDEGNVMLRQLMAEIRGLENDKQDIAKELLDLNEERSKLFDAIGDLKDSYDNTERDYNLSKEELDKSLSRVANELSKANTRLDQVKEEVKSELALLKEKEEALAAKQGALLKERADFEQERRRYRADRALYGDL